MKYSIDLIKKVVNEYANSPNKMVLSKKYNIPRATLRYWLSSNYLERRNLNLIKESENIDGIHDRIRTKNKLYSFILGLYIGDGCITKNRMSYKLRIVQDKKYVNSIKEIENSLDFFFEKKSSITHQEGCVVSTIFDKYLTYYFPQHGPGKKHERKIELSEFQKNIIDYGNLMRGLFISDGSYYLASKKYERYNFTNKSLDIINIFRECLNYFNISHGFRMKQDKIFIVEIQKKSEVLKMKEIVGFKS